MRIWLKGVRDFPLIFPSRKSVKGLSFGKSSPIRGVHFQQADRRSAYRGSPGNKDSAALEVLFPLVQPRIKESDERTAFRVKCAEVRSLCALQW